MSKKKTIVLVLAVMLILIGSLAGCAANDAPAPAPAAPDSSAPADTPAADTGGGYTFGYLAWALADEWNQYGNEAFIWCADQDGVTVLTLDCKKDPETQVSQAEEFISKGVDAISIFPSTPEAAATIARMCNEAGIPLAIENIFLPDDGSSGELVGQVACQYGDIGYAAIQYAATVHPGPPAQLLYVHGAPGMGVYEDYKIGVDRALAEYADSIEMVGLINGEWETEASFNVTMDFITSGQSDFNVIFANNDMVAVGAFNALKENDMVGIPIISTGGSLMGHDMIMDGRAYANMTAPVNIQGILLYQFLWKYLNGETIEQTKIPLPVIPVDATNIDTDWILWTDHAAANNYIKNNIPSMAR